MFDQLIETFQSVQHDLSSGLKNLSAKAQTVGKSKSSDTFDYSLPSLREDLHISAGADLLDRFQRYWTQIHGDLEESATKATETDVTIRKIARSCEKEVADWNRIQKQLQDIPQLLTDIQQITANIGKLAADFEEVEVSLLELESVIDERDYYRNEEMQIRELEQYKEQKINEESILKARLQDEFNTKLQVKQREEDAMMRERQKAFGEFFVSDLNHYKTFGKVERSADVPTPDTPLEELELDYDEQDQRALDEFLGPSEDTGPSTLEAEGGIAEITSRDVTTPDGDDEEDEECAITNNNEVKEDESPSEDEFLFPNGTRPEDDDDGDPGGRDEETSDEDEPCTLEEIREVSEISVDEDLEGKRETSTKSEVEPEDSDDDFQDAVDE